MESAQVQAVLEQAKILEDNADYFAARARAADDELKAMAIGGAAAGLAAISDVASDRTAASNRSTPSQRSERRHIAAARRTEREKKLAQRYGEAPAGPEPFLKPDLAVW